MKRLLLPLLATLALPTAVNSGIPEGKNTKWVKIDNSFSIDTEDVKIKRGKLRFYVERQATQKESLYTDNRYSWDGKIRINCDNFTSHVDTPPYLSIKPEYTDIKIGNFSYTLANYFCFLTGSEGYTREPYEPEWVKKIINNVATQKIERKEKSGNINCDSPVWKNKPRCN